MVPVPVQRMRRAVSLGHRMHREILCADLATVFECAACRRVTKLWARTHTPFELVAFRFHEADLLLSLRGYLIDSVDGLDGSSASQLMLLCAWLIQLHVSADNVYRDLAFSQSSSVANPVQLFPVLSSAPAVGYSAAHFSAPSTALAAAQESDELWIFLADKQRRAHIDTTTTCRLLSTHVDGRYLMMEYAKLCTDWPHVITSYIERADAGGALQAISHVVDVQTLRGNTGGERGRQEAVARGILVDLNGGAVGDAGLAGMGKAQPFSRAERLIESNAGLLMMAEPCKTVDTLLRLHGVDPLRLLPAMIAYHSARIQSTCVGGGDSLRSHDAFASTVFGKGVHEGLRYFEQLRLRSPLLSTAGVVVFEALLLFHAATSDHAVLNGFLAREAPAAVVRFAYCYRTLNLYGRHDGACMLLKLAGLVDAAVACAVRYDTNNTARQLLHDSEYRLHPKTERGLCLAGLLEECQHITVRNCMDALFRSTVSSPTPAERVASGRTPDATCNCGRGTSQGCFEESSERGRHGECHASQLRCHRGADQDGGEGNHQHGGQERYCLSWSRGSDSLALPTLESMLTLLPGLDHVSGLKEMVCTELFANATECADLCRGVEEGVMRSAALSSEICALREIAMDATLLVHPVVTHLDTSSCTARTKSYGENTEPSVESRSIRCDMASTAYALCAQSVPAPTPSSGQAVIFPCRHSGHVRCCHPDAEILSGVAGSLYVKVSRQELMCLVCSWPVVKSIELGFAHRGPYRTG